MTPQQIRTAYGINSIVLGGVTGNGAGQTIAIIDTYDDPALVSSTDPNFSNSDLYKFDHNPSINLPDPPSFLKLDENGGTNYPAASGTSDWSVEESLNVEWAHAIAPQANIILFEASSASDYDLITTAVNTARNWPGVTAVSMSFGRDEEGSGIEFGVDIGLNPTFTTPSGHVGVTFLASTGDSGAPAVSRHIRRTWSPWAAPRSPSMETATGRAKPAGPGIAAIAGAAAAGKANSSQSRATNSAYKPPACGKFPIFRLTPIPTRAWPSTTRTISAALPGCK